MFVATSVLARTSGGAERSQKLPAQAKTASENGFGAPERKLPLREAIRMALVHNLDARLEESAIRSEKARVDFAAGQFEPEFTFSISTTRLETPDNTADLSSSESLVQVQQIRAINQNTAAVQAQTNAILLATGRPTIDFDPASSATLFDGRTLVFHQALDRVETGIQGRTAIGTRFLLFGRASKFLNTFTGDTRDLSDLYQTAVGFELRQPILRDAGTAANLTELRVAQKTAEIQSLAWRTRVADTVRRVLELYVDMQLGLADLEVKEEAIRESEKLEKENQRRMDLGFGTPLEVQQARALVASDRLNLLASRNFFIERQFALQRLILPELEKEAHRRVFIPSYIDSFRAKTTDREALMRRAFAARSDYLSALKDAELQDIRLAFAKNQTLPQLDLVASYSWNGLDRSLGGGFEQIRSNFASGYTIGIQGSIPLGGRQGRAQLALVKSLKEQALLRIKQVELAIGVDVDTARSQVELSKQAIISARISRESADEAVRIATRRMQEGLLSNSDLINELREQYRAKSRELQAVADGNKAVTQLWQVTNSVLEEMGIALENDAPHSKFAPAAPALHKAVRQP
jgi:outer membrane protein TolC